MTRKTKAAVMLTTNLALFAASLGTDRPAWLSIALGVLLVPVAIWAAITFWETRRGSAEG